MQDGKHTSNERLLFDGEGFALWSEHVAERGETIARVLVNGHVQSSNPHLRSTWDPGSVLESEVRYESDLPVLNAAYTLAVQELRKSYNEDDLLGTGMEWSTIWTRDTAYATMLGLAVADPDACRRTLEQRVSANGEIEQDTGTGGAWPVSTDRVVWGIAAWDIYLMTGDRDWLGMACRILEETCLHDDEVIADLSGLMRGETSFLDWREQSYPDWMTPSDIAESSACSTMILHCRARYVLAEMYRELGRPERSSYWNDHGERLQMIIQELFWLPYHGYYGQYIYGRGFPVLSERSDTLAQCLAVLTGMVRDEAAANLLSAIPRCPMGVPCFFPMKSTVETPYHSGAVWPLVEGHYVLAASKTRHAKGMLAGLASLVRSALACGTNKENLNIETGYPGGLAMSSDRQLWSIAAMLGAFYKGLFGLDPTVSGLNFSPCIPEELAGNHTLRGVPYRDMILDITVSGMGTNVVKCTINGEEVAPFLPCDMAGRFDIHLVVEQDVNQPSSVNWQPPSYDLPTPLWNGEGNDLSWFPVAGADYYRVYRNGIPIAQTEDTFFVPLYPLHMNHYQVMAVSLDGRESFLCEPREYVPCDSRVETRPCGLTGDDVWISRIDESDRASFYDICITNPGVYRIDAYFANGTGSFRDGNTCALRSLLLNGERVGSLVLPHIAESGQWDVFAYSPAIEVPLAVGTYKVELVYQIYDENTNHFVNDALIKSLRFSRISEH